MTKIYFALFLLFSFSFFAQNKGKTDMKIKEQKDLSKYSKAYFSAGCFWCVESLFESIKGVKEVISGYSGGERNNPTYYQVSSGATDYAETVEIFYNPKIVSYHDLVVAFFDSHNPTDPNGQGPDRGRQYRSIAFYQNLKEKQIIEKQIQIIEKSKIYDSPIMTQVIKFKKFWTAEKYHQNYEKLHPNQSYIQNVSVPRLERFMKKHPELLKKERHK